MVYLIHFERKLHHAQHYLGFCNGEGINQRMRRHRAGSGAKILRRCNELGINYEVVRTWPDGDRRLERHLKRRKNAPKQCPVCQKGGL